MKGMRYMPQYIHNGLKLWNLYTLRHKVAISGIREQTVLAIMEVQEHEKRLREAEDKESKPDQTGKGRTKRSIGA